MYNQKIAIITYDFPHRKTQDILMRFKFLGYQNIVLFATPWTSRQNFQPLFAHRPSQFINVDVNALAMNLGYEVVKCDVDDLITRFSEYNFDHIIIAGAGILPNDLVSQYKIINSHPGYLPRVRGLDALKWAIYSGQPIGVTTYFVSEGKDEGILIEKRVVPIFFEDSFHSFSLRVYETEIEMLIDAISIRPTERIELSDSRFEPNRRMPHHIELIMIERFERLRKSSQSQK